jgi:uncharacterized iron-regulated membrane protein
VIIVGVLALATFKGDTAKAYALFAGPRVADDPRPAPVLDLARALTTLKAARPEARPNYLFVEHPGERGQHVSINATTPGRLSRGETYVIDGQGKLLGSVGYETGNLGLKVLSTLTPLHFGWFGGWPVKVAYLLLGLGLTSVTSSGVAIWLARRRAKGRPAPRWERVWIAFVWSQPFAYAVSALAALALPTPPVAVWGVATLLACAAAIPWTPATISAGLRLATAAALLLTAGGHLARNAGRLADPVGGIVDAGLVLTALLLGLSVWARKGAGRPVTRVEPSSPLSS